MTAGRDTVVAVIEKICGAPPLGDDGLDLFDAGLLDSLRMVGLVAELERVMETEIADSDLRPDNFATVEAMVALIERTTAR